MNTPVLSVGIDVGKQKLDVACMHQDRSLVHQTFSNNQKGITGLKKFLKKQRTATAVPCTLESTGSYHYLVSLSLSEVGYRVNCVNPIITKKYMRASVRDAKSDRIDAARIAEMGFLEPNLQPFTMNREDIAAKSILSALAQLETLRQQLGAHIAHAEELKSTLNVALDHRSVVKALAQIEKQIVAHRQTLCDLAPEEARTLSDHTPGLSHQQAAALLVALGERQFDNRDQLVAFVGLDVRTRQSGKWVGKQVLSKRGNGYLRKILYQIGWSLIMHNARYRDYWQRLKARGKRGKTCIIAVARKFLRFLFAYYWKKSVTLSVVVQSSPLFGASRPVAGRALAMAAR